MALSPRKSSLVGRSHTETSVTATLAVLGGGNSLIPALRAQSAHLFLELRGDDPALGLSHT